MNISYRNKGPMTLSTYQGLDLNFVELGYTAIDNMDGDLTAQAKVENKVDVYKGRYQEIVYTVTDRAGNTAREVRGVSVFAYEGLNMVITNVRITGKHKLGACKEDGIIINDKVILNQPGWYTFFAQDEERKCFVGQVQLR